MPYSDSSPLQQFYLPCTICPNLHIVKEKSGLHATKWTIIAFQKSVHFPCSNTKHFFHRKSKELLFRMNHNISKEMSQKQRNVLQLTTSDILQNSQSWNWVQILYKWIRNIQYLRPKSRSKQPYPTHPTQETINLAVPYTLSKKPGWFISTRKHLNLFRRAQH